MCRFGHKVKPSNFKNTQAITRIKKYNYAGKMYKDGYRIRYKKNFIEYLSLENQIIKFINSKKFPIEIQIIEWTKF